MSVEGFFLRITHIPSVIIVTAVSVTVSIPEVSWVP
jgi:hypothetical protein